MNEPRIVALGGGHGLAASLSALRRVTTDLTAVVTVADNGGSSGRLRKEFGVPPPGDLRMALAALCGDDRWGQTWAQVLQHRFDSEGELDGHAVGNLLIVALWELLGDQVDGLEWVADLLGARGRVLPMSTMPIDIVGHRKSEDGEILAVRGQVAVATSPGLIDVALEPESPPATPEAVAAIRRADMVVLGPGSWYTSVLPHLLVPQLREAITQTSAHVVVTMNLIAQPGETEGFAPEDHLLVLREHAPALRVDTVIADASSVGSASRTGALREYADSLGADLRLVDVADAAAPGVHDPAKLAQAYASVAATIRTARR